MGSSGAGELGVLRREVFVGKAVAVATDLLGEGTKAVGGSGRVARRELGWVGRKCAVEAAGTTKASS